VLVWFHFGGEVFESAARELFPNLLGSPIITGIALRVVQDFDSNALRSFDASAATNIIQSEGLRILKDEGLGRFADDLPPVGVKALMSDLKIEDRFKRWLTTRQVVAKQPLHESPALEKLLANSQTAPKLPLLY
jgi:hypothetical protein